uniref:Uncharacterized protein n=1 Tax=Marseillevirus LCMAC101 TaxID=2506602 RepID=A0A481YQK4_9VIRU|nr:MAG: hypothetical protein LCMAC101_00450 [Marseillevirus LCMAC101]
MAEIKELLAGVSIHLSGPENDLSSEDIEKPEKEFNVKKLNEYELHKFICQETEDSTLKKIEQLYENHYKICEKVVCHWNDHSNGTSYEVTIGELHSRGFSPVIAVNKLYELLTSSPLLPTIISMDTAPGMIQKAYFELTGQRETIKMEHRGVPDHLLVAASIGTIKSGYFKTAVEAINDIFGLLTSTGHYLNTCEDGLTDFPTV